MTPGAVPRLDDTVRVRKARGKLLVATAAETLELSDTAEFVFRNINGVRTLSEISDMVAEHYDISTDLARQDITELVEDLMARRILTVGSGG